MSAKMTGMVFDRYPAGGNEFSLALALADHAHDDGTHIFPYVETLAKKARQSVRSVQNHLASMKEAGWLITVNAGNGGRSRATEYRISPAWIKGADFASLKCDAEPQEKGADSAPKKNDANPAPFKGDEKGADCDAKGATGDVKGASGDAKGCNRLHPHITIKNQKKNHQEPSPARKRSSGFDPMRVELPVWLDAELWGRWVRHRVQIRKPLTEEAARQQVKDLATFRQQGHTPAAVIENAIGKSWQGLFAPNAAASGGAPRPGKFNPTDYVNRNRTHGGPDYDDGRTIDE